VKCVLRAIAAVVHRVGGAARDLGRRLRRRVRWVWRVHLELAEFDGRYVAALGTVAAAVFGGEPAAEAAIAGVAAVLALLVAVSRHGAYRGLP
jgi:hypothetical protein